MSVVEVADVNDLTIISWLGVEVFIVECRLLC
jgi:hypothetical protein